MITNNLSMFTCKLIKVCRTLGRVIGVAGRDLNFKVNIAIVPVFKQRVLNVIELPVL